MGRYDGTKLKVPPFRRVEPHVMQRRSDSLVYYSIQYDLTKTLPYIDEYNRNLDHSNRLTLFHVFLCSIVRGIALNPEVNRFITGRKYWQRNRLNLSFVVKKELKIDAGETFAKIDFSPFETLDTIRQKIHEYVNRARSDEGNESEGEINFFGKFPRMILMMAVKIIKFLDFFGIMPKGLIESDPLYVSAVVANLGSVKLEGNIIHHVYEWGNASMFITFNKIKKIAAVDEETNEIIPREVIDVSIAIDERISEGIYYARALKTFQSFIENPELLENPPDISEETLKKLNLKNLENDKLYQKFKAHKLRKPLSEQKKTIEMKYIE